MRCKVPVNFYGFFYINGVKDGMNGVIRCVAYCSEPIKASQ